MDIGAIFLLLTVLVLIGLFVTRPFFANRRMPIISGSDQELSTLLAERDRLITALQELDFDHTLGKIPTEDYSGMRSDLLLRASNVLRKLDVLQPQNSGVVDAESRVEAVIAARRADAAIEKTDQKAASDDDLEELIASRRAARKERSAGFCPKCGKPVLRSDRFCPHCGKSI
ncbi:MAG: zinc ribbon domain-containing protein [Chloroflexi bacterium]|nr:zinc ribbon domain-containing protein [Chloroflexota bacterium]